MTTREQLGLNANWIPMDSSKSGGSDEFLVKKVNQLEEKVNGLELSGFKSPEVDKSSGDTTLHISVRKEDSKAVVVFSLRYGNEATKIAFSYKGKRYTLIDTGEIKFEVPEILDTKLAEYGVHCYFLSMTLDDILISGMNKLTVSTVFKNTLNKSDTLSSSKKSVNLDLAIKYLDYDTTKAKVISRLVGAIRYDNLNGSEAKSAIDLSPETNTFIVNNRGSGYTPLFLHPDYKSFLIKDSGIEKISGSPTIKTLQVLDIGEVISKDEVEFTWKSADEVLKDKLIPMIIGNSDNASKGIRGDYGYYGDKSGYPVVVFSPNQRNCITYAYKSDLSEWLGYFTESESGLFIKNAKSVPNFYSSEYLVPFSQRTDGYRSEKEYPYIFWLSRPKRRIEELGGRSNYFYAYPYSSFSMFSGGRLLFVGNWPPEYRDKVKDLTYRGHIGVTLRDFDNNKTVEVWTFSQLAINSNSAYDANVGILSSLINSNTGEFISANRDYEKWKNNKCVIHQTLQRVGEEIKVVNIEVTTLDVFFKNFIAKSEEWKAKNPSKVEVEGNSPKGNFLRQWQWDEVVDHL